MVVIQKMDLESFQRCTMKGQGAEVISRSKRNSNCMSEVEKKQNHSESGLTLEERPRGLWRTLEIFRTWLDTALSNLL